MVKHILCITLVIALFSCKENIYDNGGGDIIKECNISVTSNGHGSVSTEKRVVNSGERISLQARANKGYVFKYWILDNKIVSINSICLVKVEKDSEFKAYFQKEKAVPKFVDLGLSVKWADCNVGASSREDFGDFFAWGEVEPKTSINYFWDTYLLCNGAYKNLYRYNFDVTLGWVDNRKQLTKEDDAAYFNWKDNWRIPSKSEFEELLEKCSWELDKINGIDGYSVIGPNDNSIFIPIAGYFSGQNHTLNSSAYYWSNQVSEVASNDAYALSIATNNIAEIKVSARKNGLPIRAVWRE